MAADKMGVSVADPTLLTQRFLRLPCLLTPTEAAAFLAEGMLGPRRRTWTGRLVPCPREHTWEEISIASDSRIARWSRSQRIVRIVKSALGNSEFVAEPTEICWMNLYAPGECIDPHVDGGGSAQLVIGLCPEAANGGGELLLETDDHSHECVSLSKGDAVLFDATRVKHRTTPVAAGEMRITLVVRYSFTSEFSY